jgi:hypothetical protein
MKNAVKGIGFVCLLLAGTFFVNAQSTNSSLQVSKGVQRYANKSAFDEENQKSNIQAKSVEFPAIAISKGIVFPTNVETAGNIESKGYPTWAISKGVARQNEERTKEKAGSQEYPGMDISKDENQISKR